MLLFTRVCQRFHRRDHQFESIHYTRLWIMLAIWKFQQNHFCYKDQFGFSHVMEFWNIHVLYREWAMNCLCLALTSMHDPYPNVCFGGWKYIFFFLFFSWGSLLFGVICWSLDNFKISLISCTWNLNFKKEGFV